MTPRLDKIKKGQGSRPKFELVINGPEAQKKNKHSSLDKIRRLQLS